MRKKGIEYEIADGVLKLNLYGIIRKASYWDKEGASDFISSEAVKSILSEAGDVMQIDVHINSPGGDVFESIAINNKLRQHKASVNVYIDSLAGSGASIIAMAGDKIYMPANAMLMIHKAQTFVVGNADELRQVAKDLDKIDEAVTASYKERWVGEDKELEDLIKVGTWITADEAKTFGFADEILTKDKDAEKSAQNIVSNLFEKYFESEKTSQNNIFNKLRGGKQ